MTPMRSTRAVLMSGLLAAAICSVALSAQVGGSGEPQVLGFQVAADLASPTVFGGDSVPDLVVAPASGTQSTRVFSGVNLGFLGAGFPFNPNFAGGVRVAAGDINGDGVADVVAGQGTGGSLVTLINGANITVIGSGHPFGAGFRGGVYVATADVNADGLSDIVVGQGTGGGRVMVFSGADISLMMNVAPFGPSFTGGVTVASGDVNGDGFADVFVGQASSGGAVALIDGATRGLIASATVFGNGGVSVALGDVNGDGRADAIMAPLSVNGPVVVYDVLTLTQLAAFVPYGGSSGGVRLASADFNGDGLAEIVTGPGPGGGSTVRVFSGGTFAPLAAVDVYGPGFNGGVFVAAPALRTAARFTSAAAATFTVGQAGSFTVTTSANPEVTLITETGALPAGVTFTSNGDGTATISGTPTGPGGSFPLTFNASNGVGSPAAQAFLLTVNQAPAITSAATANFAEGTANSFTVTTTGFPAPQIERTGNLPGGLTFVDNGNGTATLSGTAAQATAGDHPLALTATNGVGTGANQAFTLTVEQDCTTLTFTPPAGPLAPGSTGVAYGPISFTATPGSGFTYAVTAGALPSGLTLSPAGSLSGTPTGTGLSNFTLTATSSAGCTGTAAYTLDIAANAQNDSFLGAVGNTQFVVGAAPPSTPNVLVGGNVLANDAGAGALTVTAGAIATTSGGQVAMSANGTFVYTPAVGFAGPSDTFTYMMTDANGRTDTASVTIGIGGRVWYVNAGTPGLTGASNSPFGNMTAAVTASAPGDAIYVHPGAPAGSTVLQPGQTLAGAGANFVFGNLTILASGSPTLGGSVTLADNVLVSGITVSTGGSDAITAAGVNGAVTLSQVAITSGATGVLISGGNATMNIGATIAGTTVRSVDVQNKTGGVVTFSGQITDTVGGIFLNNNPGATIAFTGGMALTTGDLDAFTATGGGTVTATQNNTTILNTIRTNGGTALRVVNTDIGGAGLNFQSINAGTGTPSPGVGIVLDNTGVSAANGGLTVVGTGAGPLPTGGWIRRKTGPDGSTTSGLGAYLNNTKNPTFNWMWFTQFDNSAIVGRDLAGFSFSETRIENPIGTDASLVEGPLVLGLPSPSTVNGFTGSGLLRNVIVSGGVGNNVALYNHSSASALQVDGTSPSTCTFLDSNSSTGLDGMLVQFDGTATGTVNIERCRFRNNRMAGLRALTNDAASLEINVSASEVVYTTQGTEGFVMSNAANSHLTTRIIDNDFTNHPGANILIGQAPGNASAASMLSATIAGSNTFNQTAAAATASPVVLRLSSIPGQLAPARILIDGNYVGAGHTANLEGIRISMPDVGTTPSLDVTITNNHVDVQDAAPRSIRVEATQPGASVCANIQANIAHHYAHQSVPGGVISVEKSGGAAFELERGISTSEDPPVVLEENNAVDVDTDTEMIGMLTLVANGTCQLPSQP